MTENFGQSFRLVQMFVKSFFWLDDDSGDLQLVVQRIEPNGFNTIGYSSLDNINKETIYDTNVKDFYVKENYLFTTKVGTDVSEGGRESRRGGLFLVFSRVNWSCIFRTN